MSFYGKLDAMAEQGRFLCVGIDPVVSKFPDVIKQTVGTNAERALAFGMAIVESVADVAAAIKPNEHYFLGLEPDGEGAQAFQRFTNWVADEYPDLVLISDGKRMDIGPTNEPAADYYYDFGAADALTASGYLGHEAAEPYLRRQDKGLIALVRTSNPSADLVQKAPVSLLEARKMRGEDGEPAYSVESLRRLSNIFDSPVFPFYALMGTIVRDRFNGNDNVGAVAGASTTSIQELQFVRRVVGNEIPLLVPGVGKQGGKAGEAAVLAANRQGQRFTVNESSSVIYASSGADFAEAARRRAIESTNEMRQALRAA